MSCAKKLRSGSRLENYIVINNLVKVSFPFKQTHIWKYWIVEIYFGLNVWMDFSLNWGKTLFNHYCLKLLNWFYFSLTADFFIDLQSFAGLLVQSKSFTGSLGQLNISCGQRTHDMLWPTATINPIQLSITGKDIPASPLQLRG